MLLEGEKEYRQYTDLDCHLGCRYLNLDGICSAFSPSYPAMQKACHEGSGNQKSGIALKQLSTTTGRPSQTVAESLRILVPGICPFFRQDPLS